jgi:hypothetical protein
MNSIHCKLKDLGLSFEKLKTMQNFPRNPMLVHKIQDALLELDMGNLLLTGGAIGAAIVAYSRTAIKPLINILNNEDRKKVVELIGREIVGWIDEYLEDEITDHNPDDLKEVNI